MRMISRLYIYYRWHPLFGLSLPVRKRRKDPDGDRVFCESDGKLYPVPSWMLSPECSQFALGPALLSTGPAIRGTKALSELHDLLTSLPMHVDCDKPSLNSSPKEGVDEAIGKAIYPQMNLPLFNVPATATPDEEQNELTIALMELLINAAEAKGQQPENGGEDDPNSRLNVFLGKLPFMFRQSKPSQLIHNQESTRLQLSLADRARTLGFQRILVVDDDLGRTGSGWVDRPGFERLAAEVCSGEVGAIFCVEASRLARNGREWHHLIDLCGWSVPSSWTLTAFTILL